MVVVVAGRMILIGAMRPHGETDVEPHVTQLDDVDDYDAGLTQLRESCPEGWDLLAVRVERDED